MVSDSFLATNKKAIALLRDRFFTSALNCLGVMQRNAKFTVVSTLKALCDLSFSLWSFPMQKLQHKVLLSMIKRNKFSDSPGAE